MQVKHIGFDFLVPFRSFAHAFLDFATPLHFIVAILKVLNGNDNFGKVDVHFARTRQAQKIGFVLDRHLAVFLAVFEKGELVAEEGGLHSSYFNVSVHLPRTTLAEVEAVMPHALLPHCQNMPETTREVHVVLGNPTEVLLIPPDQTLHLMAGLHFLENAFFGYDQLFLFGHIWLGTDGGFTFVFLDDFERLVAFVFAAAVPVLHIELFHVSTLQAHLLGDACLLTRGLLFQALRGGTFVLHVESQQNVGTLTDAVASGCQIGVDFFGRFF